MRSPDSDLASAFADCCRSNGLIAVFAFGSRASEITARLRGEDYRSLVPDSDLDLGVLPSRESDFDIDQIVRFAVAIEEIFPIPRADVVDLRKAPPYLALDAIRGERIFCADDFEAADFELLVLRRAGDLAFHERERRRLVLTPRSERGLGLS